MKGAVLALTLAALGRAVAAPAEAQEYRIEPADYTSSAGTIGGAFYVMSTTLFGLYSQEIEGLSYAIVPGGSIMNAIAVGRGDSQFGMAFDSDLIAAWKGAEPYPAPESEIRALFDTNYDVPLHVWLAPGFEVTRIADFVAEGVPVDVDTGLRGTGSELLGQRMLAAHGLGYERIRELGGRITHSHVREAVDRLKDGHIDMLSYTSYVGDPLYVELVAARGVELLSMEPAVTADLGARYGYRPITVAAGSYEGQDHSAHTVTFHSIFICNAAVSNELAYAMTRLAFEHRDELALAHRAFDNLDPEAGADTPIPLHPGAERYFREIGALP